jgi:hypothetical protein
MFVDRSSAVDGLRNRYGRHLREMRTLQEMHEFLRHRIDLADLPSSLADLYATSDRAWHRFLNDTIRAAGAMP